VSSPTESSDRTLLIGGVGFAAVAVLILGGLSLLLWSMFARPAAPVPDGDESPTPVAQTKGPSASAVPSVKSASVIGGDVDVADIQKAPQPGPTTALPDGILDKKENGVRPVGPNLAVTVTANSAPGVHQQRIDAAIDKGVRYLKFKQANDGSWPGGPDIGYAALAGLTLLECKVPPNDPSIVKAAGYIRNHVGDPRRSRQHETYEMSLAILFLDRLGNSKDRVLIQGMALILVGGQNEAGGWTYNGRHQLTPPEMHQLLVFLKSHRPPPPALPKNILTPWGDPGKQVAMPDTLPKQTKDGKTEDPFKQLAELMSLPKTLTEPGVTPSKQIGEKPVDPTDPNKVNKPVQGGQPDDPKKSSDGAKPMPPTKTTPPDKPGPIRKVTPINPNLLAPPLQKLPVVALNVAKGDVKVRVQRGQFDDNSNTQFALMGLWAARRHDFPTEYSLKLGQQRFLRIQNDDGGWPYWCGFDTRNTMTCAGLIALAMGHGVRGDAGKEKLEDAAIQKGLRALGRYVGAPSPDPDAKPPMQNLYFLWSLERVAMLYDLKTIGGKDWYGWGAQTLLPNQHQEGHWSGGQYPGANDHSDTCFALLFLKRSNLVPDLTENLRLQMVIRDPDGR
jgi:hypothetical protein